MSYLKITFEQLERIVTGLKNKISTHTHDVVSTTKAGFVPKRDGSNTKYLRADGTWAVPPDTKYTHPTTSGNKHIPSGGSAGQILRWSADGTAQWGADNNTTYDVVSTTANGLAPKRDGSNTKYLRADGTWAVPPDTKVTVDNDFDDASGNPVANYVIDAALTKKADKTLATTSADGLMSAADKKKIDCFMLLSNNVLKIQLLGGRKPACMILDANDCIRITPSNDLFIDFGGEEYDFNSNNATFAKPLLCPKVSTSGSDYAKYCEWLDGNLENEDRRGLFVTLDGEKIKIANAEDDFILGVVSAAPGFVENAYETEWQGKYIKDIYGERITQEVEVPESTDAEDNTIPAAIKTEYVLNPEYNEDEKYIPRSQRPEWTYVGLTGELVVRDDGTCKVNGYCKPSEGGIATEAVTSCGYRVLARLDDTHIKILIK